MVGSAGNKPPYSILRYFPKDKDTFITLVQEIPRVLGALCQERSQRPSTYFLLSIPPKRAAPYSEVMDAVPGFPDLSKRTGREESTSPFLFPGSQLAIFSKTLPSFSKKTLPSLDSHIETWSLSHLQGAGSSCCKLLLSRDLLCPLPLEPGHLKFVPRPLLGA